MMALTYGMQDESKLYLKYRRSLEIAFNAMTPDKETHFNSLQHLRDYLGCEDTQTALRVLKQVCERYQLRYQMSDDGITVLSAGLDLF